MQNTWNSAVNHKEHIEKFVESRSNFLSWYEPLNLLTPDCTSYIKCQLREQTLETEQKFPKHPRISVAISVIAIILTDNFPTESSVCVRKFCTQHTSHSTKDIFFLGYTSLLSLLLQNEVVAVALRVLLSKEEESYPTTRYL